MSALHLLKPGSAGPTIGVGQILNLLGLGALKSTRLVSKGHKRRDKVDTYRLLLACLHGVSQ